MDKYFVAAMVLAAAIVAAGAIIGISLLKVGESINTYTELVYTLYQLKKS